MRMSIDYMMQLLSLRLEDKSQSISPSFRHDSLQVAEIKLANMLDNHYLTELEVLEESKTATGGVYSLSSLTYRVLRGGRGILKVKLNGGKESTEIDVSNLKRTELDALAGTDNNPQHYIFENQIHVLCDQTNPVIDIYYLKTPSPLLYTFVASGYSAIVDKVESDSGAKYKSEEHKLVVGDQILHKGFSTGSYNGNKTVTWVDEFYYKTGDAYDIDDEGEFVLNGVIGGSGQGLSSSDDYYNGAAIYHNETKKYYVIQDYFGTPRHFILYPKDGEYFGTSKTFYFLTHDFDLLKMDSLYPTLNPNLHDLIVLLAEADCWKKTDKLERRKVSLSSAITRIAELNSVFGEVK